MDVISVKVNPASGDDTAVVYTGASAESTRLGTVEKGEILKVIDRGNQFTEVSMKPTGANEPKGGSSDEGVSIATPYTYLYNNARKQRTLGRINNGTWIKILELNDNGMYKVKCLTTNGTLTGFMEARYIFRKCLDVPSDEN